ncbi:MAG TPA: DMT family transporter, partial [Candidatus Thermoplasmatota archaeon]|nr:DMT family transporter [Candidatus Thermoplasmatota archaeon]
ASWGLLSPVGKHLLDMGAYHPLGLNFVRFALATLPILLFLGPANVRASVRLAARPAILGPNVLANLSLTLFLYSLTMLAEPTQATLGFYTAPLFTAALASVALKERVGPWFAPAVVLLLAGGYLTLFGLATPGDGFAFSGMALALGSAVVWAWYTVDLRRHAPSIPLKPLMGASFLFGTLYYYALAVALEGWPRLIGRETATYGWLAVQVAFPTLAAFILFNAALQRAPASQVNILIAAELAFTVVFSALLFGETYTAWQLAGLGITVAAVSGYLWVQGRGRGPRAAVSVAHP